METDSERAVVRFEALLAETLEGTALGVGEVLELAEERCRTSHAELAGALASERVDLAEVVATCLGRPARSLCLLPVSSSIEAHVPRFHRSFDQLVLCDNKKAGQRIGGMRVLSQDELGESAAECEAFLCTSSSREVEALFADSIPAGRGISFEDFASELLRSAGASEPMAETEDLLERIRRADRPLVVLVGIYLNTYTPTLAALARHGFQVFVIARSATAWLYAGHLCKLGETLPFAEVHAVDAENLLELVDRLDHGTLFLPGAEETFIGCSFDARRTAAAYAYVAALAKLARVPVLVGLYDVVKPVVARLECEEDLVQAYRELMLAADAVTIGANSSAAGEQVAQALAITTPISSFYRYGVYVDELLPTRTDGLHLAIVSGPLVSDSANPFLPDRAHFRDLLDQELHLHVYSSTPTPGRFRETLSERQRAHFHIHDSIADPVELTRELSQYHAGMILNDTAALSSMVASARGRFLRELSFHFLTTMVPSASMLFGCAGLPIVLNRTIAGLRREFPEAGFVPTEVSELATLGARLRGLDWPRLHRVTRSARRRFSIEANLAGFVRVFEQLEGRASELAGTRSI